MDRSFGENRSRDMFNQRVNLTLAQDPVSLKKVLANLLEHSQIVVLDSHSQRLRAGKEPSREWHTKNSLLLQVIDAVAESKRIKKKIFLNYPFSVYQTRRGTSTKEIFSAVSLIKKSQPDFFLKKANQVKKDFKICLEVFYSSLFQVYLREQFATEFFVIEVPYLVSGAESFESVYLPQMNVLDDLIIFMRDGMINSSVTPTNSLVPIIPVDKAVSLLLRNIVNSSAMINNFYGCPIKWSDFFYMVSDHFTIHSAMNAYAGPEVKAIEQDKKTSVAIDCDSRSPSSLTELQPSW